MATFAPGEQNVMLVPSFKNRVYRQYATSSNSHSSQSNHQEEEITNIDESNDVLSQIQKEKDGLFSLKLNVMSVFFKFIIGKGGKVKNQIQQESGATIIIPKNEGEAIVIKSEKEKSVVVARSKIISICDNVKRNPSLLPFTHFISIPIDDPKVRKSVSEFDSTVQQNFKHARNIENCSYLMEQLHVTVLMLKLYGEDQIKKATQLFQSLQSIIYDAVQTRTVMAKIQGLEYMNDDPTEVDILYAKIEDKENRLMKACDAIQQKFLAAGLVEEPDRKFKIHVTLIRSKTVGEERSSFDASEILTNLGNFDFGTAKIDRFELSDRSQFAENGYWKSLSTIKLP